MSKKDAKEENHLEREKKETSVGSFNISERVEEQLKEAQENKQAIKDTIEFIDMYLEHFAENYDEDYIRINKRYLESFREDCKEKLEEAKSNERDLKNFLEERADENEKKNDPIDQIEVEESSSGLEKPVSELEELSESTSSPSLVKEQDCFLKDEHVDKVKELAQVGLSDKDLIKEVCELGDIKAQIKEKEEFKILIVEEKEGEGECEFKIG